MLLLNIPHVATCGLAAQGRLRESRVSCLPRVRVSEMRLPCPIEARLGLDVNGKEGEAGRVRHLLAVFARFSPQSPRTFSGLIRVTLGSFQRVLPRRRFTTLAPPPEVAHLFHACGVIAVLGSPLSDGLKLRLSDEMPSVAGARVWFPDYRLGDTSLPSFRLSHVEQAIAFVFRAFANHLLWSRAFPCVAAIPTGHGGRRCS